MLEQIIKCIQAEKYLYSQHARYEMETEKFGEIKDGEAVEAILNGKIIEDYPEDIPYPSVLFMEEPPREDLFTSSVSMRRILIRL